jgi:hypothetical protein
MREPNQSYWDIKDIHNAKQLVEYVSKRSGKLSAYEWLLISSSPYLNKDAIDKYNNNLDWDWICTSYKLDDKTMEKNIDYLDWYAVSCFQNLSFSFIKRNKELLSMDEVVNNEYVKKISEFPEVLKMYNKMKSDDKYVRKWKENFVKNKTFSPSSTKISTGKVKRK